MKDIPLVVIPALFFSLIESKFILPYHLTLCRFDKKPRNWLSRLQGKVSTGLEIFIKNSYQPFLDLCLRNRYLTLSAFAGIFAITIGLTSNAAGIVCIAEVRRLRPSVMSTGKCFSSKSPTKQINVGDTIKSSTVLA